VSDYEAALTATRTAALAAVSGMTLADQLRQVAAFHETAQALARSQFGERDTAISDYHGILGQAASKAAEYVGAMN